MLYKIKPYISPFLLTRHYLGKDLRTLLLKYKFDGNILDYGCGDKPFRNLFTLAETYKGIDFKNFSKNNDYLPSLPDFYFSKNYTKNWKLQFKDKSFEQVTSFQVLEHHQSPKDMLLEINRVLKMDGKILISAPFLGGLHEIPNDYQRITEFGMSELFETCGFKLLEVKQQGSIFSTLSMLWNEYLSDIASRSKRHYFAIGILIHPFALLFSYMSIILDRFFVSRKIFFNYIFVARKIKDSSSL